MPTSPRAMLPDLSGATAPDVLALALEHDVRFLRLQFTDILGVNKNVEVPSSQLAKALAGDIMFDGSSIEGFVRIEESDMLLKPDFTTFRIFPFAEDEARVARLICDITYPDGRPFEGDPRGCLKRQIARAAKMGLVMTAGMEAEFFMFKLGDDGRPTLGTHDGGGYFDLTPVDRGEDARRAIVDVLERMGFEIEAAHHEVAHGQHEIDFRYADALERPTTSRRSGSWCGTWRAGSDCTPRSCPSRCSGRTGAGCTLTCRCSRGRRTCSGTPRRGGSFRSTRTGSLAGC